jgi:molecular chaperone DnaK
MRDNASFISDDLKAMVTQRVAVLKAAMADRSILPEVLRQQIDALQQTLLTIGESVYQQAQQESYAHHSTNGAATEGEYVAPWENGYTTPETAAAIDEILDFANDETISADYEAVD